MRIRDLIKYQVEYNSPSDVYSFHIKDNKKCFIVSNEFTKVYNYKDWYTSYILDILQIASNKIVRDNSGN